MRRFDCPECRQRVQFVSRNHGLKSLVDDFLAKHPAKARDAAERARLDEIDTLGNEPRRVGKRARGDGGDDDDDLDDDDDSNAEDHANNDYPDDEDQACFRDAYEDSDAAASDSDDDAAPDPSRRFVAPDWATDYPECTADPDAYGPSDGEPSDDDRGATRGPRFFTPPPDPLAQADDDY